MTTRSARARYRHIWPVPHPISTIRASPGIAAIEQPRELASFGARMKRVQAVARRVAGKRRVLVEAAHGLGARVAGRRRLGMPSGASKRAPQPATATNPAASVAAARRAGEQRRGSASIRQKIA